MRKMIGVLLIFLVISVFTFSVNRKESIITLINFTEKTVSIYDNPTRETIVYKIRDDSRKWDFYEFDILEKKDSMIKVLAINTRTDNTMVGWIRITDAGIYTRTYSKNTYPLYFKPSYKSKIAVIFYDEDGTLVQVTDIQNGWLKVKVYYRKKLYEYWLPPKYQCQNTFNSCT